MVSIDMHLDEEGQAWERRPGAASLPLPAGYMPRSPEGTVLHRVVRECLPSFLAEARERSEHGFGLPRFVEEEFSRYIDCGVIARGFMRVRCGACGDEIFVGFSCKRRGVCPSCTSRRALDAAAHLVSAVLPVAPMRQWVLTVPKRVRWMLARRPHLVSRCLAIFLRALSTHQRQRASAMGVNDGRSGFVTFVQRFSSALQMNIHFHVVVPDGVFTATDDGGGAAFHRLPNPSDDDVEKLLRVTAARIVRMLRKEVDDDGKDADALAALEAASLQTKPASSMSNDPPKKRLSAFLEGFSLHAATHIHENDRLGLERLCRYGARGAITLARLAELPDGRVSYHMKRPLPDGRTHLVLTGMELLRKLAPLIPPPRFHLQRFHGVLAPNAKLRPLVVPVPPPVSTVAIVEETIFDTPVVKTTSSPYRMDWAAALKKVWGFDVLACGRCGGRLRIVAFIEKPSVVKAILDHLGLPSTSLPLTKATGPPQLVLDW